MCSEQFWDWEAIFKKQDWILEPGEPGPGMLLQVDFTGSIGLSEAEAQREMLEREPRL